jgi:hypothetical protein
MTSKLDEVYTRCMMFTEEILSDARDYSPLEVAAAMATQALSIYKTVLDDDSYEKMVGSIYESRNRIRKIEPVTLQ